MLTEGLADNTFKTIVQAKFSKFTDVFSLVPTLFIYIFIYLLPYLFKENYIGADELNPC